MHLSMILLRVPSRLDGSSLLAAHRQLFPDVPSPLLANDGQAHVELRGSGFSCTVSLIAHAVPNAELEATAEQSVASWTEGGPASIEHSAHVVVSTKAEDEGIESLTQHTMIVASCVEALGAVSVYEGGAQATHPAAFYVHAATTMSPPTMLWTGVSAGSERGARTTLLSLGAERTLGIPDLWVSAPRGMEDDALSFLFDMLDYVIERGESLDDGDTIGRSADEKLTVRYVASPTDPTVRVARIELR